MSDKHFSPCFFFPAESRQTGPTAAGCRMRRKSSASIQGLRVERRGAHKRVCERRERPPVRKCFGEDPLWEALPHLIAVLRWTEAGDVRDRETPWIPFNLLHTFSAPVVRNPR